MFTAGTQSKNLRLELVMRNTFLPQQRREVIHYSDAKRSAGQSQQLGFRLACEGNWQVPGGPKSKPCGDVL